MIVRDSVVSLNSVSVNTSDRMVTAFLVTTLGVINYQFSDIFYKF